MKCQTEAFFVSTMADLEICPRLFDGQTAVDSVLVVPVTKREFEFSILLSSSGIRI